MALPSLGCNCQKHELPYTESVHEGDGRLVLTCSVQHVPTIAKLKTTPFDAETASILAGDRGLLSNFLLTVLVPFWRQHSASAAQLNWSKL